MSNKSHDRPQQVNLLANVMVAQHGATRTVDPQENARLLREIQKVLACSPDLAAVVVLVPAARYYSPQEIPLLRQATVGLITPDDSSSIYEEGARSVYRVASEVLRSMTEPPTVPEG